MTETLLAVEDRNQVVNDALAEKEEVEKQIQIEKEKRKKMKERLYDIREEEDKLDFELDEHDKEMDALMPRIEGLEEEIRIKELAF